jgi:hypothetical protein
VIGRLSGKLLAKQPPQVMVDCHANAEITACSFH